MMNKIISILFFLFAAIISMNAQTINYNYDSLGRLTQVIYPDSNIIKYAYDATGNRIHKTIIESSIIRICPQSNTSFFAGVTDITKSYQWQVDTGNGFGNIVPGSIYTGVDSSTLSLNNAPSTFYNYKYRCIISDLNGQSISRVFTLKFSVTWMGAVDTAWENPLNWSCGALPDSTTDVVINTGKPRYPEVNTNVVCRSLTLLHSAGVLVKTGYKIDITGKNQ